MTSQVNKTATMKKKILLEYNNESVSYFQDLLLTLKTLSATMKIKKK
jgi:hypothetical protein